MQNYTKIKKGSISGFSFPRATVVRQSLGVAPPGVAPASARLASQRMAFGSKSTTIGVTTSGQDDSYTATPATGSWGDNYGCMTHRRLPADFIYTIERGSSGASTDVMATLSTLADYGGVFATAAYAAWTNGSSMFVRTATLAPLNIGLTTPIAAGDRIGFQRSGSTVSVIRQSGGGAITTLYTFTETNTATLTACFQTDGAGVVKSPRVIGAVWSVDYSSSILVTDGNSIVAGANQTTPWPTRLKARIPFNVAGCTLSNFGVSGQTSANMSSDIVTQVYPVYTADKTNALIAMEVGNSIYNGLSAVDAVNDYKNYCRLAQSRGFRVVACTVFDRQQLSAAGVDMRPAIQAANDLIMSDWNTFASDLIDTRLVPELTDSSNLSYFDAAKVHPNDNALTGFIDQCVTVLTTANPTTAGAV